MSSSSELHVAQLKSETMGSWPQSIVCFWYVDRIGRLTSGLGVLACSLLGTFVHTGWHWVGTAIGVHLVVASLLNLCPFHWLYIRLGAKEREDILLSGKSSINKK